MLRAVFAFPHVLYVFNGFRFYLNVITSMATYYKIQNNLSTKLDIAVPLHC